MKGKKHTRKNSLPITEDHGSLFIAGMIVFTLTIILMICAVTDSSSVNDNQQNNYQGPVMMVSLESASETAWKRFWEHAEKLHPDKNIIRQLRAALPEDHHVKLENLLKSDLMPAGNTFFMRRPNTLPAMSKTVIRGFQGAHLADTNTEFAITELKKIAENRNPVIQYRAIIAIIRLKLREPTSLNLNDASRLLKKALALPLPDLAWQADIHFLYGRYYAVQSKYAQAVEELRKAIQCDPFFIDARWAYIRALLNYFNPARKSYRDQECMEITVRLLENIEQIAMLSNNRSLFTDIADELNRFTGYSAVKNLAVGYSLYLSGDNKNAKRRLTMAKKESNQLPRYCGSEIRKKITHMIERME